MRQKKLGNSDLSVSVLCFGANVFGWTVKDEKLSFQLLDRCLEAGINFIDTADIYSVWVPGNQGGESETLLGKWIKDRKNRDQIILATKVGMEMAPGKVGLRKAHIKKSIDESLMRLKTDYVDLYQSHKDDESTPVEETLSTYAELVKAGKVRVIGASNYSAERLNESLRVSADKKIPRYESLQPLYNLLEREEFETKLAPLCAKENVAVISFYSLASGFLSGKYKKDKDKLQSDRGSRVEKYMNERGFRVVAALEKVAKAVDSTPSAVALAWLMAQPTVTAPIASATNERQLEELIASTRLELDKASLDILNEASDYAGSAVRA
ncbi:MAG TPA: aldo/keto reductase [Drouetiella sp.]|jgi:aryl-alcohol dehydrogenase-like predicted oxidoreductase